MIIFFMWTKCPRCCIYTTRDTQ